MGRIPVKECINLNGIIRRYGRNHLHHVEHANPGLDGLLIPAFSAQVPERIRACSWIPNQHRYRALCLFII